MRRILFLSQLVPYPPDSGPKVRSYYVLRHLAQNHSVTLLAFCRPDDSQEALNHLRSFCESVITVPIHRSSGQDIWHLLLSLFKNESFIILRDRVAEMQASVDAELEQKTYDFVHADQLWMAQYALYARKANPGLKLILDEHNACFQIFQRLAEGERNPAKRMILEREWRSLQRFEGWACSQFDQVVTVTQEDRKILEGLAGKLEEQKNARDFKVIPICVDTDSLAEMPSASQSNQVLHMGTMYWMPNAEGVDWFIREVWPLVKQRIPNASFTIVGKRPPENLYRHAELDNSIQITGYVEDPNPYLENCAAFIVPLHSGSGMRVKIVESWARGLPIVSTRIGAEGLNYVDGENILIADGALAFAEATSRLLTDADLNQKLRRNGRRWVEEQYDWRKVYEDWKPIYSMEKVISS